MAVMEPTAAAHAAPVTAHPSVVTSAETEAADVTTAETATPITSTPTAHQHQQTARYFQIGVIGIARLRERCRGRMSRSAVGLDQSQNRPMERRQPIPRSSSTSNSCLTSTLDAAH